MDASKLSIYQNPEGTLKERRKWESRVLDRTHLMQESWFSGKTVLDLGCNNGYFTRLAMRYGATRAVGVDDSDCILGARELAKEEMPQAEFWQTSLDSPEFRKYCPVFDVVLLFSVITHLRDKEEFLDWLDSRVRYMLVFESNHGEANKKHIDLVQKHMYFDSVEYLGMTDVPEKPHHMWVCRKPTHDIRYGFLNSIQPEFVPVDKILGWDENTIMNQKAAYPLDSDKFKKLKADIKKRGIRDPIIIEQREHGTFYGFQGSHRYFAAKQLGYKDVPCKVVRDRFFKHLDKHR